MGGKVQVYLNYIQIFVYALTAFIGALYLWLPEANQPSVQATIKIFGLPVLSNILLVINPILGIFGESTKRSCYYKVKFRLDFSAMLIWLDFHLKEKNPIATERNKKNVIATVAVILAEYWKALCGSYTPNKPIKPVN